MIARLDISATAGPRIGQSGITPSINEGQTLRLNVRPLNESLVASTPTSMRYRIDDLDNRQAILDWTALTPSTSITLTITAAQNAIRHLLDSERRQIVIEATDVDGVYRDTYVYEVSNLEVVTS